MFSLFPRPALKFELQSALFVVLVPLIYIEKHLKGVQWFLNLMVSFQLKIWPAVSLMEILQDML